MAETLSRLHRQQFGFAAHLRDPSTHEAPAGIEERRLQVYRELFYNNIEGLLASNFPVIRRLLWQERWHRLVRAFYREHRCHTPLFPELGREFLRYLETRQQRSDDDPPFLLELAHYEWVELALSLDDADPAAIECDERGDLLDGVPLPSPLAWPLAYAWPVQNIRPDFQPQTAPEQPTFLLLVRDRNDDVHFKGIDALGFRLMQALHDNAAGATGRELLSALAGEHHIEDVQGFVVGGARLLAQLREREAILGTLKR